ncbi:class I SAM-dependent methyltransferase [Asticcacaulis sp.]|uniref:class I SAM-dependent methyltransferase n=1 Tax=Asticcacaulis sp. TaxID=1872648 RepID=UPI00391CE76D
MTANLLAAEVAESERERLKSAVVSYGDGVGAFDGRMRTYMMRTFAPHFQAGKCLQIGCAHGDQTSLLLERFNDITVVEAEPHFIEHTRARLGDRVRFVESFVEDFDNGERYDTILFSHVLEHVIDPVIALKKLASLLKPQGRLLVAVPNAEAPSRRIAVKMGVLTHLEALSEADTAAGHRRVYRLDTLERDVSLAGLHIEASGGIFYKPLANFQFDQLIGTPTLSEAFLEGCYRLGLERPTECASLYVVASKGHVA